jgi:uncharacterized protein (DUF305 family)
MIAHHKGAIEMADTVKAEGESALVQELADAIIQAQNQKLTLSNCLSNSGSARSSLWSKPRC